MTIWSKETHVFPLIVFLLTACALFASYAAPAPVKEQASPLRDALVIITAIPAGVLLFVSVSSLVIYFASFPSLRKLGRLFSQVHAVQLLHPLLSSMTLAVFAICLVSRSWLVWIIWAALFAVYVIHTSMIVGRIRSEEQDAGHPGVRVGVVSVLLNLMLGGELFSRVAGVKAVPPWKLRTLPEETWIVDVRTKGEFTWNRFQAAESYPWGLGVEEAAAEKSRENPVLVVCLSGHRSPAVAMRLKQMGFERVYNLSWGMLYLVLMERGKKTEGSFGLTRAHIDPNRRGEDLRNITHGYIFLSFVTLIGGAVEAFLYPKDIPLVQTVIGGLLAAIGVGLGGASYLALGRNFRVYAAPRRSGTLITTGIYKMIRHPMYTGVVAGLLGYVLILGSFVFLASWLGVLILYVLKAAREEPILSEKYPEYGDYQKRSWKFVPYVY